MQSLQTGQLVCSVCYHVQAQSKQSATLHRVFDYVLNAFTILDNSPRIVLALHQTQDSVFLTEELTRRLGKERCAKITWQQFFDDPDPDLDNAAPGLISQEEQDWQEQQEEDYYYSGDVYGSGSSDNGSSYYDSSDGYIEIGGSGSSGSSNSSGGSSSSKGYQKCSSSAPPCISPRLTALQRTHLGRLVAQCRGISDDHEHRISASHVLLADGGPMLRWMVEHAQQDCPVKGLYRFQSVYQEVGVA